MTFEYLQWQSKLSLKNIQLDIRKNISKENKVRIPKNTMMSRKLCREQFFIWIQVRILSDHGRY